MKKWYLLSAIIVAIICPMPAANAMKKIVINKKIGAQDSSGEKLREAFNDILLSKDCDDFPELPLSEKNVKIFITLCMENPLDEAECELFASTLYKWASSKGYDYTPVTARLGILEQDPNGFITALDQIAKSALDKAIKTNDSDAIGYAARAANATVKFGNMFVKALIDNNEPDTMRTLILRDRLKPLPSLGYLVKTTCINSMHSREKSACYSTYFWDSYQWRYSPHSIKKHNLTSNSIPRNAKHSNR